MPRSRNLCCVNLGKFALSSVGDNEIDASLEQCVTWIVQASGTCRRSPSIRWSVGDDKKSMGCNFV